MTHAITRQNSAVWQTSDLQAKGKLPASPKRSLSVDAPKVKEHQDLHNNASEKKKPLNVQVIGISHLVQAKSDSLMQSNKEIQVATPDSLVIDTSHALLSRRGPNQEVFDQVDLKGEPTHLWYPVLELNEESLQGLDFYIREDAFLTDNLEKVKCSETVRTPDFRKKRRQFEPHYDFPIKHTHQERSSSAIKKLKADVQAIAKRNDGPTPDVKGLIAEFCHTLSKHLGGTFMSCLYGSYATGSQKAGSDVDVLFSCDNTTFGLYRDDVLPIITDFVANLHQKVGARVDDEVPPESKLIVSAQELMEAAKGQVFYPQGDSKPPKIHTLSHFLEKEVALDGMKKSDSGRFGDHFLASKYLRMRLLFNILTTPNDITSNMPGTKHQIQSCVTEHLQKLSDDLKSMRNLDQYSGVEHLLGDAQGNQGEMYLGYKAERNGVIEHLEHLLKQTQPTEFDFSLPLTKV